MTGFGAPEIEPKWRAPIGPGYSGPTVTGGRVYVSDRIKDPVSKERIHCFDWETGERLWTYGYECAYGKVGYPAGPRASVTIHEGRAYSLGTVGHLVCVDAVSGKLLWAKQPGEDYRPRVPTWGLSGSPVVEGEVVIVQLGARDGACLMAFDKVTGEERWRAVDDVANYTTPIVIDQGQRRVVVCWTGTQVAALNPPTGDVLWAVPFPPKNGPIGIATPVRRGPWLLVSSFYDGSLMLRVADDEPGAQKAWHRLGASERATEALHCLMSTPIIDGDYVYGIDSYGALRCVDARTGHRLWSTQQVVPQARWAHAHLVRHAERVWIFTDRGELVICRLSPEGYEELSRARLIDPDAANPKRKGKGITWAHPAFAYRHVFARSDSELVCADLRAP